MVPELNIQIPRYTSNPELPTVYVQHAFTRFLQEKWRIVKQAYAAKDTFEFVLRDTKGTLLDEVNSLYGYPNRTFNTRSFLNREVVLVHGDFVGANERHFLFGGIITEVTATSVNAYEVIYKFNALGWAYLFDDTIVTVSYPFAVTQGNVVGGFSNDPNTTDHFDVQQNLAASTTTGEIYGDTTSMFNRVEKDTGSTIEHPFTREGRLGFIPWIIDRENIFDGRKDLGSLDVVDKSISSVLNEFANHSGYIWRVDSNKTLHFRPPNQVQAGATQITLVYHPTEAEWYTGSFPNYPYHKFSRRIDITKLKNHIIMKGGRERSDKRVREFVQPQLTSTGEIARVYRLKKLFVEYDVGGAETETDRPKVYTRDSASGQYAELRVGKYGSNVSLEDLAIDTDPKEYDVFFYDNVRPNQIQLATTVNVSLDDDAAIVVEGYTLDRVNEYVSNDKSVRDFGRKSLVITQSSTLTKSALNEVARGKLFELSQNSEVLKLKVLVDSTGSNTNADPTHTRSVILRDLDAAKTVKVINPLHGLPEDNDNQYLIATYILSHLGGEVYEVDLTLTLVYPELLPTTEDEPGEESA